MSGASTSASIEGLGQQGPTLNDAMHEPLLSFNVGKLTKQKPTESQLKTAIKVGKIRGMRDAVLALINGKRQALGAKPWRKLEPEDLIVDNIATEDQMYGPLETDVMVPVKRAVAAAHGAVIHTYSRARAEEGSQVKGQPDFFGKQQIGNLPGRPLLMGEVKPPWAVSFETSEANTASREVEDIVQMLSTEDDPRRFHLALTCGQLQMYMILNGVKRGILVTDKSHTFVEIPSATEKILLFSESIPVTASNPGLRAYWLYWLEEAAKDPAVDYSRRTDTPEAESWRNRLHRACEAICWPPQAEDEGDAAHFPDHQPGRGRQPPQGGRRHQDRKRGRARGSQKGHTTDNDQGTGRTPLKAKGGVRKHPLMTDLPVFDFMKLKPGNQLHTGQGTAIMTGLWEEETCCVKATEIMKSPGGEERFLSEIRAYQSLAHLQGIAIPRVLGAGLGFDGLLPSLILEHCGAPLAAHGRVPGLRQRALSALELLHQAQVRHGDARIENFVVRNGQVRVLDLEAAQVCKDERALEIEMRSLAVELDACEIW